MTKKIEDITCRVTSMHKGKLVNCASLWCNKSIGNKVRNDRNESFKYKFLNGQLINDLEIYAGEYHL